MDNNTFVKQLADEAEKEYYDIQNVIYKLAQETEKYKH